MDFIAILKNAWKIIWSNKFLWVLGIPASFGRLGYLKLTLPDLISNFLLWVSKLLGSKEMATSLELFIYLLLLLLLVFSEIAIVSVGLRSIKGFKVTIVKIFTETKPLLMRAIGIYLLIAIVIRSVDSLLGGYQNTESSVRILIALIPAIILSIIYEIAYIYLVEKSAAFWQILVESWFVFRNNPIKWLLVIIIFVPFIQIIFSTFIVEPFEISLLDYSPNLVVPVKFISYLLHGLLEAYITIVVTLTYLHLREDPVHPPSPA